MNKIKRDLIELRAQLMRHPDFSGYAQLLDKLLFERQYLLVPTHKITDGIQFKNKDCDFNKDLIVRDAKFQVTTRFTGVEEYFKDDEFATTVDKELKNKILNYLEED